MENEEIIEENQPANMQGDVWVNMENGNARMNEEDMFFNNLMDNNNTFLQNFFQGLQHINPDQFGRMDFNTFRGRIQQNVIQDNPQRTMEVFENFVGGQEVLEQVTDLAQQITIDNIDLDNTIAQLQNTFYKMDSLSKQTYDNGCINKQIKTVEKYAIKDLKSTNDSCKQATKKTKSILECDKKISELNQDINNLQTYKNKLLEKRNILFGILMNISISDLMVNRLINFGLNDINPNLFLPDGLEQEYKPNFIDKLEISKVLKDTEKTFNKVKSAFDEIGMELQEVRRQINSMNHQ